MQKVIFIFNKMNLDGVVTSRDHLLKKYFGSSRKDDKSGRCEVLVSQAKPFTFKYYKNIEVLSMHPLFLGLPEPIWNSTTLTSYKSFNNILLLMKLHARSSYNVVDIIINETSY